MWKWLEELAEKFSKSYTYIEERPNLAFYIFLISIALIIILVFGIIKLIPTEGINCTRIWEAKNGSNTTNQQLNIQYNICIRQGFNISSANSTSSGFINKSKYADS